MKTGYIPDSIYRALPWIYMGFGAITMLALRNWMAVASGAMLMSAGALVWTMRYFCRNRAASVRNSPKRKVRATRFTGSREFTDH